MKKNLIGTGFIITGIFVLWACFFKLAPWLISLIPTSCEWRGLIEVAIYILVGYFGGIGLPLFLMVIGVVILFSGGKNCTR